MAYICERCHYQTHIKTRYVNHLSKTKTCPPVYSSKEPSDLLHDLQQEYNKKPFGCEHCELRFSHKCTLKNHVDSVHPDVQTPNVNTAERDINQGNTNTTQSHNTTHSQSHNSDNNHHNSTTNNNTHNNTHTNSHNTTNNNITININPVGKEDIRHILEDTEFLTSCLQNVFYDGLPNLLEKIHLDPEHPENNNLSLRRMKHPRLMKMLTKDEKEEHASWKEVDAETALYKVIYRGCDILVSHNNKLYRIKEENNEATIDDEERHHYRNEKLNKLKTKKRAFYPAVKNNVLARIASKREKKTKQQTTTTTTTSPPPDNEAV